MDAACDKIEDSRDFRTVDRKLTDKITPIICEHMDIPVKKFRKAVAKL
jgi:hypothetical protein